MTDDEKRRRLAREYVMGAMEDITESRDTRALWRLATALDVLLSEGVSQE
jgi:hypothetical protein